MYAYVGRVFLRQLREIYDYFDPHMLQIPDTILK